MANDPHDSSRLPGPGERIRRLAQNPVPSGGEPSRGAAPIERRMYDSGVPGAARMAVAGAPHDAHGATAHAANTHAAAGHGPGSAHGSDAHGHHPTAGM